MLHVLQRNRENEKVRVHQIIKRNNRSGNTRYARHVSMLLAREHVGTWACGHSGVLAGASDSEHVATCPKCGPVMRRRCGGTWRHRRRHVELERQRGYWYVARWQRDQHVDVWGCGLFGTSAHLVHWHALVCARWRMGMWAGWRLAYIWTVRRTMGCISKLLY